MAGLLKHALKRSGLYDRIKYSLVGRGMDYLFHPARRKKERKEYLFYRSFLPQVSLIFDIGANDGHKTIVFASLARKVIACEPDPHNLHMLNSRFRHKKNIFIEPLAVSDRQGTASLYIHQPGSALNTINPKWKTILETENKGRWNENIIFSGDMITVKTTTLDALIAKHGVPDMIKIDVEGHEKNVLNGLSQPVKFISFEVLLPEFLTDALYCLDRLMVLNEATRFNYAVEEKH